MSWTKISLSVKEITEGKAIAIQDQFEKLFVEAKGPENMAMFTESFSDRDDDTTQLYFTPVCENLLQVAFAKAGIESCEYPSGKIKLLIGHADAKSRFFENS